MSRDLYEKAFDQVMISPTPLLAVHRRADHRRKPSWTSMPEVVILITDPADRIPDLCFNGWSFLVMFLNGAVFSAIGVVVSFHRQKPCRRTAFFQLHHHADGLSVQHLLLHRKASRVYRKVCICTSAFPDQSSDPKHFCR